MSTAIASDLESPQEAVPEPEPEHVLPMATLTEQLAAALTGSRLVDGHLMWLAAEASGDRHLVVEATRVRFDEPTDVAVRIVLDVSAPQPVALPAPPDEDDLMACGCHSGYCYCDGYDPADASAACSDCGQLECGCTTWVPAVRADRDDPDLTEPSPS